MRSIYVLQAKDLARIHNKDLREGLKAKYIHDCSMNMLGNGYFVYFHDGSSLFIDDFEKALTDNAKEAAISDFNIVHNLFNN